MNKKQRNIRRRARKAADERKAKRQTTEEPSNQEEGIVKNQENQENIMPSNEETKNSEHLPTAWIEVVGSSNRVQKNDANASKFEASYQRHNLENDVASSQPFEQRQVNKHKARVFVKKTYSQQMSSSTYGNSASISTEPSQVQRKENDTSARTTPVESSSLRNDVPASAKPFRQQNDSNSAKNSSAEILKPSAQMQRNYVSAVKFGLINITPSFQNCFPSLAKPFPQQENFGNGKIESVENCMPSIQQREESLSTIQSGPTNGKPNFSNYVPVYTGLSSQNKDLDSIKSKSVGNQVHEHNNNTVKYAPTNSTSNLQNYVPTLTKPFCQQENSSDGKIDSREMTMSPNQLQDNNNVSAAKSGQMNETSSSQNYASSPAQSSHQQNDLNNVKNEPTGTVTPPDELQKGSFSAAKSGQINETSSLQNCVSAPVQPVSQQKDFNNVKNESVETLMPPDHLQEASVNTVKSGPANGTSSFQNHDPAATESLDEPRNLNNTKSIKILKAPIKTQENGDYTGKSELTNGTPNFQNHDPAATESLDEPRNLNNKKSIKILKAPIKIQENGDYTGKSELTNGTPNFQNHVQVPKESFNQQKNFKNVKIKSMEIIQPSIRMQEDNVNAVKFEHTNKRSSFQSDVPPLTKQFCQKNDDSNNVKGKSMETLVPQISAQEDSASTVESGNINETRNYHSQFPDITESYFQQIDSNNVKSKSVEILKPPIRMQEDSVHSVKSEPIDKTQALQKLVLASTLHGNNVDSLENPNVENDFLGSTELSFLQEDISNETSEYPIETSTSSQYASSSVSVESISQQVSDTYIESPVPSYYQPSVTVESYGHQENYCTVNNEPVIEPTIATTTVQQCKQQDNMNDWQSKPRVKPSAPWYPPKTTEKSDWQQQQPKTVYTVINKSPAETPVTYGHYAPTSNVPNWLQENMNGWHNEPQMEPSPGTTAEQCWQQENMNDWEDDPQIEPSAAAMAEQCWQQEDMMDCQNGHRIKPSAPWYPPQMTEEMNWQQDNMYTVNSEPPAKKLSTTRYYTQTPDEPCWQHKNWQDQPQMQASASTCYHQPSSAQLYRQPKNVYTVNQEPAAEEYYTLVPTKQPIVPQRKVYRLVKQSSLQTPAPPIPAKPVIQPTYVYPVKCQHQMQSTAAANPIQAKPVLQQRYVYPVKCQHQVQVPSSVAPAAAAAPPIPAKQYYQQNYAYPVRQQQPQTAKYQVVGYYIPVSKE